MKRFTIWKDRSSAFRDVNFEAIVNFQERRESEAMNKWKLAGLKVQAQLDSATKIRERSVKRTFRKTFIYWRQSAVQRRPAKQVDSNVEIAQIGPALNSEGWSEMGDDNVTEEWAHRLDGPITSVPLAIPGYLNTPSKRAGRVTAVAARLSTTPRGPLSTKSERQLRAQYSKGFLPSTRHGPGRSALGTDGGFADIIDKTNK
jgi:protein SFI1